MLSLGTRQKGPSRAREECVCECSSSVISRSLSIWPMTHLLVRYTDPKCPLVLNFIRRQLLSKEPIVDARGRTTVGLLVSLGDESVGKFSSSFTTAMPV